MEYFKQGAFGGCGFFIIGGIFLIFAVPLVHIMLLLLSEYVHLVP